MKAGNIAIAILLGIVPLYASKKLFGCGNDFKLQDYSGCHAKFKKCIVDNKTDKTKIKRCQKFLGDCLIDCTPICYYKCDAGFISCKAINGQSEECKATYSHCIDACQAKGETRPFISPAFFEDLKKVEGTKQQYVYEE